MYKYFGLVSMVLLAVGLLFVVRRWPRGVSYAFSQHVALRRSSIIYYAALFFVTMPLLVLFFVKWFVPEYRISHWFTVLAVSSAVAQCACTLVPETGGMKSVIHRALAGISAILLIPALLVLLQQNAMSTTKNAVILLSVAIMTVIIGLVALTGGNHRYFLVLQMLYFASFFAPILFISYLK